MPRFNFWPIYGLFALSYLIALFFSLPVAVMAGLKVMPILLLLALLVHSPQKPVWLWPAVLFSAAGDLLLALPIEQGFVYGLAAFLVAQLSYGIGFWRDAAPLTGQIKSRFLFVAGISAALAAVILPASGGLLIAVSLYLCAIAFMALGAARYNTGNATVFVGALLFVLSDSVIAINKFLWPFSASSWVIMVTYYAAQGLMVTGVLRHWRRVTG